MSGHSKWSKIKRKKGANDAKRGAIFTKLAKLITIAAAEGGGDPGMNFTLRLAMDKAKEANMPIANIERAVKKGTGEIEGGLIQKISYEATGISGSAFIVQCSSDNTNRTVSEVRNLFESAGGALVSSGSTAWQFDEVGLIEIWALKLKKSEQFGKDDEYVPIDIEELELELYDIEGIQNIEISKEDNTLTITTEKNSFSEVHKTIESMDLKIDSADLAYVPKDPVSVDEKTQEKILKLMSDLDDSDDVDNVFTNVDLE